jgi:hypothetical protein
MRILAIFLLLLTVLGCNPSKPPAQLFPVSVTFIGNSWNHEGINFDTLQSAWGYGVDNLWKPGAVTAWAYATLRQLILTNHVPNYVVLTNCLNYVTQPTASTTGTFADDIAAAAGGNQQILDTIAYVEQNAANISDPWDFKNAVSYSFLPRLVALAQEYNFRLVIMNMRIIEDAQNPQWESDSQRQYRSDLAAYLGANGAILLDYSFDPEIETGDFYDTRHLTSVGREKWTRMIASDFTDIFNGKTAFHQLSDRTISELPILQPASSQNIVSSQPVSFQVSSPGNDNIKWSYCINGCPAFETFLGTGANLTASILPFDNRTRAVWVYAYDGTQKTPAKCALSTESGTNLPPQVSAGGDQVSYIGRPTAIHATATDDLLSPAQLTYKWDLLKGTADLHGDDSSTLVVTPYSWVVIRVSVSDGQYSTSDIVLIMVTAQNQFVILSPSDGETFSRGDTVMVKWQVVDVQDCIISVSYDAGLTYELVSQMPVTLGDSLWGNYPWVVPLTAPKTDMAYLKLANYEGTVTTISDPFSIRRGKR